MKQETTISHLTLEPSHVGFPPELGFFSYDGLSLNGCDGRKNDGKRDDLCVRSMGTWLNDKG